MAKAKTKKSEDGVEDLEAVPALDTDTPTLNTNSTDPSVLPGNNLTSTALPAFAPPVSDMKKALQKTFSGPQHKKPNRPAAKKESFYAMISDPTDQTKTVFINISDQIGRAWLYKKPKATCAVRVGSSTVAFTMLMLTARTVSKITDKPVEMPRGPLAKLERHAGRYADLTTEVVVVESENAVIRFTLNRDANKVASLSLLDIVTKSTPHFEKVEADAEVAAPEALEDIFDVVEKPEEKEGLYNQDGTFILPKSSVQLNIYLRSPRVAGYVLALGFIHHFGKAGDTETIGRVTAKSIALATQLADFRLLAGIESVEIPPAVNRANYSKARSQKAAMKASGILDVQLFKDPEGVNNPELITSGHLSVDIDLEHINQASGKLLYNYTPDKNLAPSFEMYRSITNSAVTDLLRERLGVAELEQIVDEVVLGMVTTISVEALKNALKNAGTFNLTPSLIQRAK